MGVLNELQVIVPRKVIAATISSSLFAVVLSIISPDPFNVGISSVGEYIKKLLTVIPIYLLYSLPVILLYGTITSIISDYLAHLVTTHSRASNVLGLSFVFHILFGAVLLWHSILAASLFFFSDYLLRKRRINKWSSVVASFSVPLILFILSMCGIHIIDMFGY